VLSASSPRRGVDHTARFADIAAADAMSFEWLIGPIGPFASCCDERRELAAVVSLAGVVTHALYAEYASRCSECERRFGAGAVRWCVTGHKLHPTCVKHVMNREVCPIYGILHFEVPSG
jgi:hypothetical protein